MRGDTYNGAVFTVTKDLLPLDLTGVTMRCQFRLNRDAPVVLEISTGSGITITDAAGGIFEFDSMIIDVVGAVYKFDVEMTFLTGEVKTYISGTMTITPDITHG